MPPPPAQQPIYAQIADDLRAQISAGTLGGIHPLPSDKTLMQMYGAKFGTDTGGVSRNSVREALRVLRDEGLITTIKGRGSYVSPPMPNRLIQMTRYRDEMAAVLRGEMPALDDPALPVAEVSVMDADEMVSRLFDVPTGTRVVRRHWVSRVSGLPAQVTTSFYLTNLVPDVDAPILRLGGGVIAYLISVGVTPTRVREVSSSRPPTAAESAVFPTAVGWVHAISRQIYAEDRVVEVAREIVLPPRGVQFEHEISLPRPTPPEVTEE